jgi:hypothetical protein
MAAIVITQGANLNPTSDFLPKRSGNSFVDSPLEASNNDMLRSIFSGDVKGINLEPINGLFEFGDFASFSNGTFLRVNDNGPYIEVGGLITTTTGTHIPSGTYLQLYVNGTPYFLNLLT